MRKTFGRQRESFGTNLTEGDACRRRKENSEDMGRRRRSCQILLSVTDRKKRFYIVYIGGGKSPAFPPRAVEFPPFAQHYGESSSLERIGSEAFSKSGLTDIFIPSRVKELGAKCFWNCPALSRVTFGKSSSLERIGPDIFLRLPEIVIPQTIEELLSNAGYTCKLQVETTNSSSTA